MIGRGHGEIRMDPLHVLGVEMRRLANVLTIVVAVSAGLTACAPPKKDLDPKLASLLLETKTPWEIKPPSDLKVLLDGTRKIGREDRWLETMRSAVSPTAVKKGLAIPEGHLARYEKEMARALRDKDMDRIGEVNGFMTYLQTADVERRNERLLALYRASFAKKSITSLNFSHTNYQDALNRLEKSSRGNQADQAVLIWASINYLDMVANKRKPWGSSRVFVKGEYEQQLLNWLKDYILNNQKTDEENTVKNLMKVLDPGQYQRLFPDASGQG